MSPQVVPGFAALVAVLVLACIGAARRGRLARGGRGAAPAGPAWIWPAVTAVLFMPGLAALVLIIVLSGHTGR